MSQVKYIDQRNLFREYGKQNKLTSYDRIFYTALFERANELAQRTGNREWPDDYFPVSNSEMQGSTGLDYRAIRNTRNRLQQMGLIDYIKGDRRSADPKYKINYLTTSGWHIVPVITDSFGNSFGYSIEGKKAISTVSNDVTNDVSSNVTNGVSNDVTNTVGNYIDNNNIYIVTDKEKEIERDREIEKCAGARTRENYTSTATSNAGLVDLESCYSAPVGLVDLTKMGGGYR